MKKTILIIILCMFLFVSSVFASNTIFYDDFNRVDSININKTYSNGNVFSWHNGSCSVEILNNELKMNKCTNGQYLVYFNLTENVSRVDMRFKTDDNNRRVDINFLPNNVFVGDVILPFATSISGATNFYHFTTSWNIVQSLLNSQWYNLTFLFEHTTKKYSILVDNVVKVSAQDYYKNHNSLKAIVFNGNFFLSHNYNPTIYIDYIKMCDGLTDCPSIMGTNNFSITAKDYFNNNVIYNFSALINGTTYYSNVSTGLLTTNINSSLEINFSMNISSNNYFTKSYYVNISQPLNALLYASIINITGKNPLNVLINNWTLYNGTTILLNTSTSSGITYLSSGTYNNLRIVSNTGSFAEQTQTGFTINSLDNKTINLTIYDYNLNISAKNLITTNNINNFSITIFDKLNGGTRNYTTTTGSIIVGVLNSTYNVSIDATGYSLQDSSILLNLTGSYNYTFQLYTTNSLNISFRKESDGTLIASLITIDLIGAVKNYNFSTSTGKLFVDLLSPQYYTLQYGGTGYQQRNYYFTLVNRSYNELTLYLSSSALTNVTIIVYDETNKEVENVEVQVLKYDSKTNSYILVSMGKTNFEGQTQVQLQKNNAFYKFALYYNNELKIFTQPTYIYTDTLTFNIIVGSIPVFDSTLNINHDLTFNTITNNCRFDFSNSQGTSNQYCLETYRFNSHISTLLNTSCITTSAGSILLSVPAVNGTTIQCKSFVYIDGQKENLKQIFHSFSKEVQNKNLWLFLFLILVFVFAMIGIWNIKLAVILTPIPLFLGSILGVINVSPVISGSLIILGIILAVVLK